MISSSLNLQNLISEFANLPGLGRKSAGRLAYYIANAICVVAIIEIKNK